MTEDILNLESELRRCLNGIQGTDTNGKSYTGLKDLWALMFQISSQTNRKDGWYEKASNYWENEENCPITDGFFSLITYF
jgi:hypothetical protein